MRVFTTPQSEMIVQNSVMFEDGTLVYEGQPVGVKDQGDVIFFKPQFFQDFPEAVMTPTLEVGKYGLRLTTWEGDEVKATPMTRGWRIELLEPLETDAPIVWFEDFLTANSPSKPEPRVRYEDLEEEV